MLREASVAATDMATGIERAAVTGADGRGADPAGIPVGSYLAAGNGGRCVVVLPSVRAVFAMQPNEQPGQPPVPLSANVQASSLDGLIRDFLAAYQPA